MAKKLTVPLSFDLTQMQNQVKSIDNILKQLGTKQIPLTQNLDLKSLDKYAIKIEEIEKDSQQLVLLTRQVADEYGRIVKIVDTFDKATGEIKKTTYNISKDIKGLDKEWATAQDKHMNGLHAQALVMNKSYDEQKRQAEALAKSKMNLMHSDALTMNKEYDEKKKADANYTAYWQKALLNRDIEDAKYSQQRIIRAKEEYNQLLQQAGVKNNLGDAKGMLGGSTGSANPKNTIWQKFGNSLIYSTAFRTWNYLEQAIRGAIQANSDYEQGLINLSRTIEASKTELQNYGKEALNLSQTYGVSLTEVQNAMTELARAGIDNKTDILAMTEAILVGLNTTEIETAEEMTAYLISTVRQLNLSMSDSMDIIDSWNKLADKYAVQSDDFAAAIQRAGSASHNLGLSLHDVNAMVVILGEATQASGEAVGTALKSLETRLLRPDTVKTLERFGIIVKKDNEHFLSFQEIMNNISRATRNLGVDSIELNKIMDTLGGAWRRNWAQILATNWSRFVAISAESLASVGYSIAENVKVMDTYEKKIQVMKATFTELYITLGEAGLLDMLKGMVDGVVVAVNAFQKLSPALKQVIIVSLSAYSAFKLLGVGLNAITHMNATEGLLRLGSVLGITKISVQGMEAATQSLKLAEEAHMITAQESAAIHIALSTGIKTTGTSADFARVQANAFSVALKGTASSAHGLQLALGIITIVLSLAIGAITSYNQKQERARQIAKDLAEKFTSEATALKALTEQYMVLMKNSELTEDNKSQLLSIQDDLINTYGLEADALDLVNGKYQDQIGLINQVSLQKAQEVVRSLAGSYQIAKDEINKPIKDFLQGDTNVIGYDTFFESSEGFRTDNRLFAGLEEKFGKKITSDTTGLRIDNANLEETVNILGEILSRASKYDDLTKNEKTAIEKISAEYNKLNTQLQEYKNIINTYEDAKTLIDFNTKFADSISTVNDLYYQSLTATGDTKEAIAFRINNIKDAIKTTLEDEGTFDIYEGLFNNLFGRNINGLEGVETSDIIPSGIYTKDTLKTLLDADLISLEFYYSELNKLKEQLEAEYGFNDKTPAEISALLLDPIQKAKVEEYFAIIDAINKKEAKEDKTIVKVNAYQSLENSLTKVNAQLERNAALIDLASDDEEKQMVLIAQRLELLKDEQEALHILNEARRAGIQSNIGKLRSQGFVIDYNPATNELLIKNMSHVNDLASDLREEYGDLITETTELNDANIKASTTWYTVEKEIKSTNQTLEDLYETIRDARISIEDDVLKALRAIYTQEYNDRKEALQKKYDLEVGNLNRQKELITRNRNEDKYQDEQNTRYAELAELQAKHQRLLLDPTSTKERLELEKEIAEKTKEIKDAETDYLLDAEIQRIDDEIEAKKQEKEDVLATEEDNYEAYIADATNFNAELQTIMSSGQTSILAFLMANSEEFKKAGKAQGEALLEGWREKLGLLDLEHEISQTKILASLTELKDNLGKLHVSTTFIDELFTNIKNGKVKINDELVNWISDLNNLSIILQAKVDYANATTQEARNSAHAVAEQARLNLNDPELAKLVGSDVTYDEAVGNVGTYISNPPAGVDTTDYSAIDTIYAEMKANADAWKDSNETVRARLVQRNEELAQLLSSSYGITLTKSQGVWYKPDGSKLFDKGGSALGKGLMYKDTIEPERILSPQQTKSFDRLVDVLERLPELRVSVPSLSGLLGLSSNTNNPMTEIRFDGDIIVQVAELKDNADYEEVGNKIFSGIKNKMAWYGNGMVVQTR